MRCVYRTHVWRQGSQVRAGHSIRCVSHPGPKDRSLHIFVIKLEGVVLTWSSSSVMLAKVSLWRSIFMRNSSSAFTSISISDRVLNTWAS